MMNHHLKLTFKFEDTLKNLSREYRKVQVRLNQSGIWQMMQPIDVDRT